ncbi:MAG TPA: formylmethanofuran--tetrahydromethanopterin N-formyltransferase [Lacipirellulaceae bacterium]
MRIGPTEILDTHAEAFATWYARLVITAIDDYWLEMAIRALAGYGTSVIGCDAEVGVERLLPSGETPDGRPGAAVLLFAFSTEQLAAAVGNRVGQCVLTCPTTSCFNGVVDSEDTVPLGDCVRYFGDGFEKQGAGSGEQGVTSSLPACWQIPVMDGAFLVDAVAGVAPGIGGGNILLHASSQAAGLSAGCRAAEAIRPLPGVITSFPGGVCRSGSKVGSKYKNLVASTAETYCPTLRDQVDTQLVDGATCAYEIVIDGVSEESVAYAMRAAIEDAAGPGVLAIGASNFGGRLGRHLIRLHDLFLKA